MPIRFPPLHIAQSVVNRILNAADALAGPVPGPRPTFRPPDPAAGVVQRPGPADYVPEPAIQGAILDEQLAQPAPAMPPAGAEGPISGPQAADQATAAIGVGGKALPGLLGGLRGLPGKDAM